jgi:hypothetical protein
LLVCTAVTTFNDYSKELQFRALKKFAANLMHATVIRDG